MRNEVKSRASPGVSRPYYAEDDRAQRQALILRDVAYVLRADIEVRDGVDQHPAKYRDQFERRVQRGQCWHMPYLGCREFSAYFGPTDPRDAPIARTEALGNMLFGLEFGADGKGTPRFFEATLGEGVLRVPPELYQSEGR